MVRVAFLITVAVLASGCAQKQTLLPPPTNAVIDDMGWKSKTSLSVGPEAPAPAAVAAPVPAKPALAAPVSKPAPKVRAAARKTSPAMAAGMKPPPAGQDPQAWKTHTHGTCYSTGKAKCGQGCLWVAASNGKSGFCTAKGSF